MLFALFGVVFAPPLSAQSPTREAYVAQSADKSTLTFYYDAQRDSRTGTTWGIGDTKKDEEGGVFPGWAAYNDDEDMRITRVVFDASFLDYRPISTARWFANLSVLWYIDGLENLNTEKVTDMSGMFAGCSALRSLDLRNFNTENVTSMAAMFAKCSELKSLNINSFNTAKVTTMLAMFGECRKLMSLNVTKFNTAKVNNMGSMFHGCANLESLDLKSFNTDSVSNMGKMFYECSGLSSLDLRNFNTSNVTTMTSMFEKCTSLKTIYSSSVWQSASSERMFANCIDLRGAIAYSSSQTDATMANPSTGYFTFKSLGVLEAYVVQSVDKTRLTFYYDKKRASHVDVTWSIDDAKKVEDRTEVPLWVERIYKKDTITKRVVLDASFRDFRPTTTKQWFARLATVTQIEGLEYLNTENVTDMYGMFSGCSSLTSLDLQHFNTEKVTDMSGMFMNCSGLTALDLQHLNTEKVTDMTVMFAGCSGLRTLDLQYLKTENVTNMHGMFANCSGLTSLDLSSFKTENVKNTSEMFSGCTGLTSLNLRGFNTSKVEDMEFMFSDCTGLPSLDLSGFNTSKVEVMDRMFSGCTGLITLNLENFKTVNFPSLFAVFEDCSNLTTIYCNDNWRSRTTWNMFKGCTKLKGAVPYDEFNTAGEMANPETGYFTKKNPGEKEVYVTQSADKKTLTFYYDAQRATRTGKTWGIEERRKDNENLLVPMWIGSIDKKDTIITRLMVDASFRDFYPTTTNLWFANLGAVTQIEGLENLNTEKVTDMFGMFSGCSGLTSLTLQYFNTQNVTDMFGMFLGCSALTSLDLQHLNTSKVEDMGYMFSGCSGLTSLDLQHFNTEKVTNLNAMFRGCSSLTSLDLRSFNTSNVAYMGRLFEGCTNLTKIYSETAWTSEESSNMFKDCLKLKGVVAYDANKTDATMANSTTGYFTVKPTALGRVNFANEGAQTIYTLQGKRVHEAWQHLPAGVYVVNGKKVIK